MSSETAPKVINIQRRILYWILAVIVGASLASAFTHMHDWTIHTIDEALMSAGSVKRTPGWIGWANAVISELLPAAAFLLIRERHSQRRSVTVPVWIFIGSAVLSLVANLSATGVEIPGAAQFLACLPALATIVLSKVIFSDLGYAAEVAERLAAEAAQAAERAAEQRRRAAEQAAELRRREAEQAAEREAEQRRRDAELAAELDRKAREHEAELAERQARIAAEAETRRAEIEAADREAERQARERREAREAELRRAAEVERARVAAEAEAELQRAEARRVEAAAEAQRQAAARLAELQAQRRPAPDGGDEGVDTAGSTGSRRMSSTERAELAAAVLTTLPAGTERPDAVKAVARELGVSAEYARRFVPAGFVAGGSAGGSADGEGDVPQRRHLSVAAAS
jgi:hypothetical protein